MYIRIFLFVWILRIRNSCIKQVAGLNAHKYKIEATLIYTTTTTDMHLVTKYPSSHSLLFFLYSVKRYGFSVYHAKQDLVVQSLLANEKTAHKSKYYNANHEREPFVGCPAIRAANDPGDCRIEGSDVVKTLSHSVHDLIDVFAVVQRGPQSGPEKLLDNG